MIRITKIVDSHVVDEKLDLEALQKNLPATEEEIRITLVATERERKADRWTNNGKKYFRIILDYDTVLSSNKESVLEMMRNRTLEVLADA
jgi:hypothetical protein